MKQIGRFTVLLTLCGLPGCGGETLALASIGFIAPIGGNFNEDGDLSTTALEATGHVINIQIGTEWDQFYDTRFNVTGTTDLNQLELKCPEFSGTVDGKTLTAVSASDSTTECFSATFANESRLILDDGTQLLRNFPINLSEGTWVNINRESQEFKFEQQFDNSFSGCEIENSVITPVNGTLTQADVSSGVLAAIPQLNIQKAKGSEIFQGKFEGSSGIVLKKSGKEIRLQRRKKESECQ